MDIESRMPLMWYQDQMMHSVLRWDPNVENIIKDAVRDILPYYNRNWTLNGNLVSGGSPLYNKLIQKLPMEISFSLTCHGIREKYAWLWMWPGTEEIIKQSFYWFDDVETCKAVGDIEEPSFDVVGNSTCPEMFIQSVCVCITTPPSQPRPHTPCNKCLHNWKPQKWSLVCGDNVTPFPELMDVCEDEVGPSFDHNVHIPKDSLGRRNSI